MPDPTYNGVDFFGPCPISNRTAPPNARQVNGYPGVNGCESINHGYRQSYTDFEGLWVAESPDELGAFIAQVEVIKRTGAMGTLIDTSGFASVDAILDTFSTIGRTAPVPGGWGVAYRMRFLHLGVSPGNSGSGSSGSSGSNSPGNSTSATTS